jgi:UDP-glucose 4-epimerase
MSETVELSGRRVLVTGAGGFIGAALSARMLAAGAEVHGVSRSRATGTRDGVRWWNVDLSDIDAAHSLLSKLRPEFVYHLAGHVFGSRSVDLVLPTLRSNLVSTVNLLVSVADLGCRRIVLAGSLEEPQDDGDDSVPSSPYAVSKWAASAYGRMVHALYDAPVVIPRIFVAYGPGQDDDRKLLPYVIRSLLRGESPELSSGSRPVVWIYIDDLAEGRLRVATAPALAGGGVDLGSGQAPTVREVVELIADIVQSDARPRFGILPDRPMEQVRIANAEESYRKLGWRPQVPLIEGLRRTVKWHAEQLASDRSSGEGLGTRAEVGR